jgi:hypothetical protein
LGSRKDDGIAEGTQEIELVSGEWVSGEW